MWAESWCAANVVPVCSCRQLRMQHTDTTFLRCIIDHCRIVNCASTSACWRVQLELCACVLTWAPSVSQLLLWTLMLRLHPKPLIYTPSYEYSVSFAGVAFGVATGLRRAKHLHSIDPLLLALWRQGGTLAIARRLALGAAACVVFPP